MPIPPPLDPYEELGVAREATSEQVRAAYRRKAKASHPDAGGSADRFERIVTSQLVLLDPLRREKFDRTGTVDEAEPDNVRANALQIIEAFIEEAVAGYINSNFAAALDPRRRPLLADFLDKMNNDVSSISAGLRQIEKSRKFVEDMAGRFAGTDAARPIERGFERRLARLDEMKRQSELAVACRSEAAKIARTYKFANEAPDVRWHHATSTWSGSS